MVLTESPSLRRDRSSLDVHLEDIRRWLACLLFNRQHDIERVEEQVMAQDAGGDGRQYGLAVLFLELRIRELAIAHKLTEQLRLGRTGY